jgi:hypothetical protein
MTWIVFDAPTPGEHLFQSLGTVVAGVPFDASPEVAQRCIPALRPTEAERRRPGIAGFRLATLDEIPGGQQKASKPVPIGRAKQLAKESQRATERREARVDEKSAKKKEG